MATHPFIIGHELVAEVSKLVRSSEALGARFGAIEGDLLGCAAYAAARERLPRNTG